MLRATFSFTDAITIIPIQEITVGNARIIKEVYEVRMDCGDHTKTMDKVQVPRGSSRAAVREAVAASMLGDWS